MWAHTHTHTRMHPTCRTAGHTWTDRDLAQLLVDAEVVHHHGPVQHFQQRVLREGLLGLLGGPPQQQALVPVAALNWKGGAGQGRATPRR